MDHEQAKTTRWAQVAAWTFGAWALVVPLSAAWIVEYQARAVERQEQIQQQLASLRAEVITLHADARRDITRIDAEHADIRRRLDRVERLQDGSNSHARE